MDANTRTVKKLSKVGEGTAVFLSQEVRRLGWKQGEYVSVEVTDDKKEQRITLRRIKI